MNPIYSALVLLLLLLPSLPCRAGSSGDLVEAVKTADFKRAEDIIRAEIPKSRRKTFDYETLEPLFKGTPAYDADYQTQLDRWVLLPKNSAIPYLVRAEYYYKSGWYSRGEESAKDTEEEKMHRFIRYMDIARKDITRSIELDGTIPYSHYLLLLITRNDASSDATKKIFGEAIRLFPDYSALYDERLEQLTPKWGGSIDAMIKFAFFYSTNVPRDSARRLLPLFLYKTLLLDLRINCGDDQEPSEATAKCQKGILDFLQSAAMEQKLKEAFGIYPYVDHYVYDQYVLLAVLNSHTLMRSGLMNVFKIARETVGEGHYPINVVYGNLYADKQQPQEAVKYYKLALSELKIYRFRTKEKAVDTESDIDMLLAENAPSITDALYYAGKSIELDDKKPRSHMVLCKIYYLQMDYQKAIDQCNATLALTNNPEAQRYKFMSIQALASTPAKH